MTSLPPVLARWARELAGLPAPLAATLAPWLGRLAVAVGPLPGDRRADAGELDGVEGLARRGSYERLLIAEWAIADELPDEFLRRAAGGEHLFVARAHRAPPRRRTSVVLVSAGPSQLGTPRLVHVAALVVMARRAAASGASLAWGVLERPAEGLATDVDVAALARLLDARTATTAGPAHADAWRAALAGDDRWLVGGDEHAAMARTLGASLLVVRDPLEPAAAALEVEVRNPDSPRSRAQLRLPLPAPDDAARLLRELGQVASARTARLERPMRRMWFVQGGRRLAIDLGDRVEVWPVPSSPREPVGNPRVVHVAAGETLIALGMRRRRTVLAVTARRGEPEFVRIHDASHGVEPRIAALPPSIVARLLAGERAPPGVGFAGPIELASGPAIAFTGPTGALLVAANAPHGFHVAMLGDDVPTDGGVRVERGLVFVKLAPDAADIVRADADGIRSLLRIARATPPDGEPGVRWGCALPPSDTWGPIAVRLDDRRWIVVDGAGVSAEIENTAPVYGALVRHDEAWLVVDDDGPALRGRDRRVPLFHLRHPIVDGAGAAAYPVVAWATAHEVIVYSLQHDAIVLRIAQGAT